MTDLKREVLVSNRQLELLLLEYVGVAPKNFASMARYQYLWNALVAAQILHGTSLHFPQSFRLFLWMTQS